MWIEAREGRFCDLVRAELTSLSLPSQARSRCPAGLMAPWNWNMTMTGIPKAERIETGTQLLLERVKSQGHVQRSMSAASRTVRAMGGRES